MTQPDNNNKSADRVSLQLKNLAIALIFSVLLGPVGLLYATTWGGTVMIILAIIAVCSKLPVPVILVWLLSCIWSVAAVNKHNKKVLGILK